MANVNIKFNNKDYLLYCDEGQQENLVDLANHLDLKYGELKKNLGNIGENKLLLITAIKMVDDYFDLLKKINFLDKKFREKPQNRVFIEKNSYTSCLDRNCPKLSFIKKINFFRNQNLGKKVHVFHRKIPFFHFFFI